MGTIEKEKNTIKRMIEIYCYKKHGSRKGTLCKECEELLNYAYKRLELCPFQENKPPCKKCPIHCYKPELREKIKKVMRFSGPYLLIYSPFEWFRHKLKEIKFSKGKVF
jgi:hypothetical protein